MARDTSHISERCQGAAWPDGRVGLADDDSRRLAAYSLRPDEDETRTAKAAREEQAADQREPSMTPSL